MTPNDIKQVINRGATDLPYFSRLFFPEEFSQPPPDFHRDIFKKLYPGQGRHMALEIFRGGGKTTLSRLITAHRIAYGISRTVLYIGKSDQHARYSVDWIKDQFSSESLLSSVFGTSPGQPWTGDEIQIKHSLGHSATIISRGILGSVRGINIKGKRPDFIVLDDILDDEMALTIEQLDKMNRLVMGAVRRSLAPKSENSNALLLLIGTSLDERDVFSLTRGNPAWAHFKYSCFDHAGKSSWPARFSTEDLQAEKEEYLRLNLAAVWFREMEVSLISDTQRHFRIDWLVPYHELPKGLKFFLGIDPSPPKDEDSKARKPPDPEAMILIGILGKNSYLIREIINNDPNPERTWEGLIELHASYPLTAIGVETVVFQKSLKWYLEKRMQETGIYIPIIKQDSKVEKTKRIRHGITTFLRAFKLHYLPHQTPVTISQFSNFPKVKNDDGVDALDIACRTVMQLNPTAAFANPQDYEDELEPLTGAP